LSFLFIIQGHLGKKLVLYKVNFMGNFRVSYAGASSVDTLGLVALWANILLGDVPSAGQLQVSCGI
jgi:hypothetical protein